MPIVIAVLIIVMYLKYRLAFRKTIGRLRELFINDRSQRTPLLKDDPLNGIKDILLHY